MTEPLTQASSREDVAFSDLSLGLLCSVGDRLMSKDPDLINKPAPLSEELITAGEALCAQVYFDGCIRQAGLIAFIRNIKKSNSESPANPQQYKAALKDFQIALTAHLTDMYEHPPADISENYSCLADLD